MFVGQRVRARFAGKNHLYNGNIIADNGDGTYGIEYDDGDWEDESVVNLYKQFNIVDLLHIYTMHLIYINISQEC